MISYQAPKELLCDKTILVTGAGDGIGKQASLSFADKGATCILLGKTVEKLTAVYDEIVAAGGPEPAIIPLDLNGATPKHYQEMAVTIKEQFSSLDGVLFNASMLGHLQPFSQVSVDEWQKVMQVNLNSSMIITQSLLPILSQSKHASVVYTTSSVGRKGRAFWGSYAVSKFATEGMMQVLADEYKNSSIRFNCINPGATRTAMRAKAYPAETAETLKTPADIMPSYLYLMGDASIGINGESIDCQPK